MSEVSSPEQGDRPASTELVTAAGTAGDVVAQRLPMMSDAELDRSWRVAKSLAMSGVFDDVKQTAQAYAKILLGRDLGLSPQRSMAAIQFVKGNVQIHYRTLLAFVRENGYDYQYPQESDEDPPIPSDPIVGENPSNDRAVIDFYGRRDPDTGKRRFLGRSRFSQEDAARAGIDQPVGRNNEPSNYVKYPRNMLIARATSNGIGWYCPEVLAGIPVYTEGEIPPEQFTTDAEVVDAPARVELPERITGLLERVHAIDTMAWRRNEVAARLPQPDAEGYEQAVAALAGDIEGWLSEREAHDAEVVSETIESQVDPSHDELLHRYQTDEVWRAEVDRLLNQRAALEEASPEGLSDRELREVDEQLNALDDTLAEYGVPAGWVPVNAEQTSLGV